MAKGASAGSSLVHGTAIALSGAAALIRGGSGTGKSDLALRCLATAPTPLVPTQAVLVADDQVLLSTREGRLLARCPDTIRGLIEVRGVGIVPAPSEAEAELRLVVDLAGPSEVERLPSPGDTIEILGVRVNRLVLAPYEASSPIKLLLALYRCGNKEGGNP